MVDAGRWSQREDLEETMVTVSGDWTPPYTVEVWTDTEAVGEVIALPGFPPEVILVRPDRPLREEEKAAVNEYFRRVYPHIPTPFPDAEGPGGR